MKTIILTDKTGKTFSYNEKEFNNLKEGGMMWEIFPDAPEFFPEPTKRETMELCLEIRASLLEDSLAALKLGIENSKDLLAIEEARKDVDSRKNQLYIKTIKSDIETQQIVYHRICDIVCP